MEEDRGTLLNDPPTDGISSLKFLGQYSSTLLLASSWDSTTRLYDTARNSSCHSFSFQKPQLASCFNDTTGTVGFSGGLDNEIHYLDLSMGHVGTFGKHSNATSCLQWSAENNALVSGGWDGCIKCWDVRQGQNEPISSAKVSERVYALSATARKVVVVVDDKKLLIFDTRNLTSPAEVKDSPLKNQTRSVVCFPDSSGYAIGSIEGRIAVEYFDSTAEIQQKKYAFKCHRKGDLAYPVNALAAHPVYGTFASGGCDGTVSLWDGGNRKKLTQLPEYPTSISSLAFSSDGTVLAIASSYTYEEGEKDHPSDQIYLKTIQDYDVKPRPKQTVT